MSEKAARKINVTRDYRLFRRSSDNRPTDHTKRKKLYESMTKYGWLSSMPMSCFRNGAKELVVKDGQHRLAIAEQLGLAVYWVEELQDFDIALVNCGAKGWTVRDYARKHATNGIKVYQDGMNFAEQHGLPIGIAFALLAGTVSFKNIESDFTGGTFRIKDRNWADAVAGLYGQLISLSPCLRTSHFLASCMAICRVPEFDPKRILQNAKRCREKLISYATRDAYLDMLEDVYNFGRNKLFGLKAASVMAMRERCAVNGKKKTEKANA